MGARAGGVASVDPEALAVVVHGRCADREVPEAVVAVARSWKRWRKR